jgi:hypothetical protein
LHPLPVFLGTGASEVASQNSDSTSVGAPTFLWLECAQHAQQSIHPEETGMARKYSRGAQRKVMKERKRGTLKSGRSGKKVKNRKQAIAIGLAEARRAGKKVPKKRVLEVRIEQWGSSARQASEPTLPALTASTSRTEEIFYGERSAAARQVVAA